MTTTEASAARPADDGPATPDAVSRAVENFQAVQGPLLRWALLLLPWGILAVLLAQLVRLGNSASLRGTMYFSGVLAAALSLFAFQFLARNVPESLGRLWDRGIIGARSGAPPDDSRPAGDAYDSTVTSSTPAPLEAHYSAFIYDLEAFMNSPWQWLSAVLFALLAISWRFFEREWEKGQSVSQFVGGAVSDVFPLPLVAEVIMGFFIGLMVWRMVASAYKSRQLRSEFELFPQLGHPDKCAGFEPLGNLYLWNAVVVLIPAIWGGIWIILGPSSSADTTDMIFFEDVLPRLLLIPLAFGLLVFFVPVWSVHRLMANSQVAVRRQLDLLGQRINSLLHETLDRADSLDIETGDEMSKKVELLQRILGENRRLPTWPFNFGILLKLMTVLIVPVLGLLKEVIELIERLS